MAVINPARTVTVVARKRWGATAPVKRLVSVKHVWLLGRKPGKHLVEFWLVRPMPEHENVLGVDVFAQQ